MPSFTPPVDPGRLTMRTSPARPARPRDSMADGIPAATPAARIDSAIPGTSRSMTLRVISGVRSLGVNPVPPVVTITRYPEATPSSRACSTGSPSLTTRLSTAHPASASRSASTGPDRSSYTPADARFEIVTASARTTEPRVIPPSVAVLHASLMTAVPSSRSWPAPHPGLAAGLLVHPHVGDHRRRVHRLDHVDQRQRGHGHRRERLHLDARPVRGPRGRRDRHPVVLHLELDRDGVQPDGVTQRDQVRGLLRALDSGDPGHGNRIALRNLTGPERLYRFIGQQHASR